MKQFTTNHLIIVSKHVKPVGDPHVEFTFAKMQIFIIENVNLDFTSNSIGISRKFNGILLQI